MTNKPSTLDQLPQGARVAVVRIRSLGDSVLTTPAVHLLKQARPDLQIAIVSEPRFAPVWAGNPNVSAILEPRVSAIRSFAPDLCLNLHGGSTSARLTGLSGARFRAGFRHFRYRRIYNVRIPSAQEVLAVARTVHTAEHASSAMFYLGVPQGEVPRAQLYERDSGDGALQRVPVPGPYAVIHPVASQPDKTWPATSFEKVAHHIKRDLGLQPVFIAGPGEDLSGFQMWPVMAGASLEDIKRLLARSSLFVGNDSGPAHMAAAFGLPLVVIFGPSDHVVWAPWKTEAEVLKAAGPIASITDTQVMRALDRMRVHA